MRIAAIPDSDLAKTARFVLAAKAQLQPERLQASLPTLVKIGPVERIRDLVNLNLPGIALRSLPVAPRQIPYHAGFLYFALDRSGDLWKVTEQSRALAMHIAGSSPGSSSSSGRCVVPDDPFADLGADRTVIMPMPGGRVAPGRPAPAEQRATPAEQAEASEATAVGSGLNPLLAAANRLLNVLPQLRCVGPAPEPTALRDSLAQGVRQFEAQARTAGVPTEKIVAARYALCTLIDETATSTPLGASGAWAHQGLLALFHGEVGGGQKFFQLLARLAENPQANIDLLELLYVCLEFGFEGRYRVTEGGQRRLEAIRQRLLMIIRKQRGEYERDLSPNWRGVSAANQRRLGWMPLWAVGAVSALLLVVIYVGFEWRPSRTSDKIAADIAALRVAAPVPPRPSAAPRLAAFLAEEIQRGLVKVDDNADRSVVTILGDGLFKPGEAAIGD